MELTEKMKIGLISYENELKDIAREIKDEFKRQIVTLYHHGKTRAELIREYELTPSALNKWINNYETTGSSKHQDNLSDEQKRLNDLKKENKQLKMENDILKQEL